MGQRSSARARGVVAGLANARGGYSSAARHRDRTSRRALQDRYDGM